MEDWKEAWWLTKFEFKKLITVPVIIILFIGLIIFISIVNGMINSSVDNNFMGLDILLVFLFIFILPLLKLGNSKSKGLSNHHPAAYLIRLHQLPIKNSVIVKHRFLTSLLISIPLQVLVLLSLYLLSPNLQELSLNTYLAFIIIWVCLSIYIGSLFITFDAGVHVLEWIITLLVFGFLIFFIGFIGSIPTMTIEWNLNFPPSIDQDILSIQFEATRGIINWTLLFAEKQPLLSSVISIILAIVGWDFWSKQMLKRMNKVDYL